MLRWIPSEGTPFLPCPWLTVDRYQKIATEPEGELDLEEKGPEEEIESSASGEEDVEELAGEPQEPKKAVVGLATKPPQSSAKVCSSPFLGDAHSV